ncbi:MULTISPECIES: replication protein [Burkholderia cepacia complex]|uniref:Uncharacterized protein n=1 Tax=Burkholderia stabilis TaxID=95485 RepID=A0AAJ5T7C7_9BURK|nr:MULTISPECIES: replication protein [Burkholderia cepacia complex]CAJ7176038.1 Uncharacterised protein [Burkholderia pseudomallei]VBB15435.1 hypothetical protein BSTAB16_5631 [Burkholderia stabilis]
MRIKPWAQMPTEWITDSRIMEFKWTSDGSAGTAALMLFFVLCQCVSDRRLRTIESGPVVVDQLAANAIVSPYAQHLSDDAAGEIGLHVAALAGVDLDGAQPAIVEAVAHVTYDEFGDLTGLSRKSISAGLKLLEERGMIRRYSSTRTSEYVVKGLEPLKRWAKLPGRALLSPTQTSFKPFAHFSLRSKNELNALKLHFYYASVRNAQHAFSECTFETIHKKTGVAERDITRANAFLLNAGMMSRYGREELELGSQIYSANRYYMEGYNGLFIQKAGGTTAASAAQA